MRGGTGSAQKLKRKSSGGIFSSSLCPALLLMPGLAFKLGSGGAVSHVRVVNSESGRVQSIEQSSKWRVEVRRHM